MKLDDVIADSRTSLDEAIRAAIDQQAFARDVDHLSRLSFWDVPANQPHLWDHQKAAVGTIVAYLNGDKAIPERPEHKEAALLKLPTGTGKSGIIAVAARCLPHVRRVLVLTPRTALAEQLLRDIRYRFWKHLGCQVEDGKLFTATVDEFAAPPETVYTESFLPSRGQRMSEHLDEVDRAIFVGTHQALGNIRKTALGVEPGSDQCLRLFEKIRDTFDLVIVDEGHYEPAVSWSRGVRKFNLPTLLLSATPYRNDFKSFRVRGRYVFNYPYADAVRDRVVRPVQVIVPEAVPKFAEVTAAVRQFVELMQRELPERLDQTAPWFSDGQTTPKVMVRADDLDTLEMLQTEIDRVFETASVLIHDNAKKAPVNHNRFQSVSSAARARPDAQFWIHQFKLMEGIDDPTFVAIAIFDLMGNARQLVQQIGRATRHSSGDRRYRQSGWVLAACANAARIATMWQRYTRYEKYAADNTAFIVANEVTLPDRLLDHMAEYQYIDGEFRGRFEFESPLAAQDVQLPRSAAVLQIVEPRGGVAAFAELIEEAFLDKDRFKITPIEGMPERSIGFSYYAWRNSPLLIDRFFSEWKLGIFVAFHSGDFIFMHDTEGLVIDVGSLGLERADRSLMEKIFPERGDGMSTRLSRMSFSSLDMSQHAIRSMAVRTRSFEDVFTDLLDPSLVPATAAGFVNGIGRYVGFARSRLRDAAERYVPIDEYEDWVASVSEELADDERSRCSVFARYAAIVEGLTVQEAQPASILLDPSQDSFMDMREDEATAAAVQAQDDVDYDDLCADVRLETGEFTVRIGAEDVPCTIEYQEETEKYRLQSERLNELFPARETNTRRQGQTLVQRLNQAQAFRVLVQRNGVVYSEGRFYEPRLHWVLEDGAKPILDFIFAADSLRDVDSEKGEQYYEADRARWHRHSIFGLFAAACSGELDAHGIDDDELTHLIKQCPMWLCDDDNLEVSDFIGVNTDSKKIVFVHAKKGYQEDGGCGYNVGVLQIVGRQALASLAFLSRDQPSDKWSEERWVTNVQANTVTLVGRNRIFGNVDGLTAHELNERLHLACRNPSFDKEIWIVGCRMARRDALSNGLNADPVDNRLRQFLMHWDALQTACARANVRLRFFCS